MDIKSIWFWVIIFSVNCCLVSICSLKKPTCRPSSRCCRTQNSPQTSSGSGRRPTFLWCRRSTLTENSRWKQRALKTLCRSAEPQWLRAVYKCSPAAPLTALEQNHCTLAYVSFDTESAAAFDATDSCEQAFLNFFGQRRRDLMKELMQQDTIKMWNILRSITFIVWFEIFVDFCLWLFVYGVFCVDFCVNLF